MTSAHAVSPDDELRHPADSDDLWNESYYADFVQEDGSLGGWLRLGLYPNQDLAWWTAWVVGPNRRGVCSVRYDTPVPAGFGLTSDDALSTIAIDVVRPLAEFRVAARARAEVVAHPQAVYTDELGIPAALDLDLTWTTDGTPYHYDLTTRYEIPCTVAGTVTIDGTAHPIRGQGQRDHSWGVRDWWAFGWCWSSARLDDGTRVHLADIRMPGMPIAFGYIQTPEGGVFPITTLSVEEELGAEGLPTSAAISLSYGDGGAGEGSATAASGSMSFAVTPVAFGPVLLRNKDDGRTSRFPRAMVQFRADDGRGGLGWIEWNQPQ